MLQKILVILVGLVMSLVGAFAPSGGLFASHPATDAGLSLSVGQAHDETLATVRAADGTAFAKVSVLWVEVDGRRVTEDAWGTGQVNELRFKIGTKDVDGLALAVGDRVVALHATDVMTVRMFDGEFAYRGMGTPAATLALQGTVKTMLVSQGPATGRVLTQGAPKPTQQAPADGKLAYVVLDTGRRVDTVAVESSSQRLFTAETGKATTPQPGNLLARYVKVNGQLVKDYTSGDGTLESIEFQPAFAADDSAGKVDFNGEAPALDAESRVLVKDFVGEYLIYQVGDGLTRIRLDGYAASFKAGAPSELALPQPLGGGEPHVALHFDPATPRTADTITFHDDSVDDGYVVFRQWTFGDGATSVQKDPTHRYTLPGPYDVTLNVTDNDLNQRQLTVRVNVRNSDPVPDFDFAPKVVDTSTIVTFADKSDDIDGSIVNWTWDFGDPGAACTTNVLLVLGTHACSARYSFEPNPSHQFVTPGNVSVTLTVTDNLGGRQSLSKVVVVRDAPPLPNFDYSPPDPQTLVQVNFRDLSTDRDGTIVGWNWSFGDGAFGSTSAPSHKYPHPGLFPVSLTVTDNNGVSSTVSQNILVQNRAPIADFVWGPVGSTAEVAVQFTSTSTDPDGVILLTQWEFGDGSGSAVGNSTSHTFPRQGVYPVTVHVTDGIATSTLTRTVAIADAAPRASLTITPNPTYRSATVLFADTSTDFDGDAITSRLWTFGDGNTSTLQFPTYTYQTLGEYPITLTVTDSAGKTGNASTVLRVLNRAPVAQIHYDPVLPIAARPVNFSATGTDFDDPLHGASPINYTWGFGDGTPPAYGENVVHTFARVGDYRVTLVPRDTENGVGQAAVAIIHVDYALPEASFDFAPAHPNQGETVTFTDHSTTANEGGLLRWTWSFGDGGASTVRNPTHTFVEPRTYTVTLSVVDAKGKEGSFSQNISVNGAPIALFTGPSAPITPGTTVQFGDLSSDPENETLTYAWDLGDGNFSSVQSPQHTYLAPGAHTVRLTVTDPWGASGTATRVVNVQDRAPIAGFTYSVPLVAGQPVSFDASQSHDPDGDNTLTGYSWSFGDNSVGVGRTPAHTYANSGIYGVSLTVTDGMMSSTPAVKTLRVGSDHPITLRVRGNLPGGRDATLSDSHVKLSMTLRPLGANPTVFAKGDLVATPPGYDLVLNAGDWIAGDSVVVSVQDDRWMSAPLTRTIVLSDNDGRNGPVSFPFDLSMPLVPTIRADAGDGWVHVEDMTIPVFPNQTADPAGTPVYRDMLERFHGNGTVFYLDGAPATAASVIVEARYLPLNLVAGLRDSNGGGQPLVPNNFVLGWCRADVETVNVTGGYTWSFRGADCLQGQVAVFPVGVWQVRATSTYSFATSGTSDPQTLLVDPTGGLLWRPLGMPP